MKRRWIIRSFFLGLLLLCVGGWAGSYAGDTSLRYYSTSRCWWAECSRGKIFIGVSSRAWALPMTGWSLGVVDSSDPDFQSPMHSPWPMPFQFLGFGFDDLAPEIAGRPAFLTETSASIPCWFFTTLAALVFYFTWRKTRQLPAKTAFPVEVTLLTVQLLLAGLFAWSIVGCAHAPNLAPHAIQAPARAAILVKALGSPQNDARANAAKDLRTILAADPSAAPHWHDKGFWAKRIENIPPHALLQDALAILLPEMSPKERDRALEMGDWSGDSGSSTYRLDDYWLVTFTLTDLEKYKLVGIPTLQSSVREQPVKPTGDFTGLWVTWYVNGLKASEIQCRNGQYDGTFIAYYDDGPKSYEFHYLAGVCDGPETGWYKSGKLMYQGQFKNGKQDGTWQWWYEDGHDRGMQVYKNGKLDYLMDEDEDGTTHWGHP